MDYKQIKTLKGQVEEMLKNFPDTRNSDIALMIKIWQTYYNVQETITVKQLYDLPREDNIKRVRAHFQNDDKLYWPTDEKIAKARGINVEEWRVAMGYPTTEGSYTPPSEELKEWTFKSETSNTIYTVKDLITSYVCNCPGFNYRQTCKHVDEVKRSKSRSMAMF